MPAANEAKRNARAGTPFCSANVYNVLKNQYKTQKQQYYLV